LRYVSGQTNKQTVKIHEPNSRLTVKQGFVQTKSFCIVRPLRDHLPVDLTCLRKQVQMKWDRKTHGCQDVVPHGSQGAPCKRGRDVVLNVSELYPRCSETNQYHHHDDHCHHYQ